MEKRETYEEPLLTKHDALRDLTAQLGSIKTVDTKNVGEDKGDFIEDKSANNVEVKVSDI